MNRYMIIAGKVIDHQQICPHKEITIQDGLIREPVDNNILPVIDFSDCIVVPGLFDTHIHGYRGADVMDGTFESLNTISKGIVEMGVTHFLATTLTSEFEKLENVCRLIGERGDEVEGASLEGIFLEGPYFTEKYKGAQNEKHMGPPSIQEIRHLQQLARGKIVKIAIAPEWEGTDAFIRQMKEWGIVVALGHSNATYEQAKDAVEAGASVFVHTYNAMRPLHHREPGMVGAAMNLKQTYSELICDGHHVHPVSANIMMDVKGRDHILLVTDCMRAGGQPEGHYRLGTLDVESADGAVRMKDGTLAGSVLQLGDALANVVHWDLATLSQAVDMATYLPAKSQNLTHRMGLIEPGRSADLLVLDTSLKRVATVVRGKIVRSDK